MYQKLQFGILILFVFNITARGQNIDPYYINWNVDHTQIGVRPSIAITEEEARIKNCYSVIFDKKNRFRTVKYYHEGNNLIY